MADDLSLAEAAYVLNADNDKIIVALVRGLEERGLLTVVSNNPIKVKMNDSLADQAYTDGKLSPAEVKLISALEDGIINPIEEEAIIAAHKAAVELKLAEKQADRAATRAHYQGVIANYDSTVRAQTNPAGYCNSNLNIWFWLWLADRYHYTHQPQVGTYVYPTPDTTSVREGATSIPVTDPSFHQVIVPPSRPHDACVSRPHDACVSHSDCVTRPHDACVSHSNCVSKPHDACVSHSNCVTHSNCVSRPHSACVSHSNCVSRPR